MNIEDAKSGMRVRYVPNHADGDITHSDCEDGFVTSVNQRFIFVCFRGIACNPDDLIPVSECPPMAT